MGNRAHVVSDRVSTEYAAISAGATRRAIFQPA
jgi:hypothetical protein